MNYNSTSLRGVRAQIFVRHWQSGNRNEAVAVCTAVAADPQAGPEELRAIVSEALAQRICPAFRPAAECAGRLLAQAPDPALHAARAHFFWVGGRTREALDELHACLRLIPQQPNVLARLALIELEAGLVFEAFRSSGAALAFDPRSDAARCVWIIAQRLLADKAVVDVPFAAETLHFKLSGKTFTVDAAHISGRLEEPEELQALYDLQQRWPVMVDVGGNVGNHAVAFHRCFRPDQLFIYEVNPRCIPVLSANLALNPRPGGEYEIRTRGLGATRSRLFLPLHDDLNTGLQEQAEGEGESVDVVPLDDELPAAHFLKIDVEGMEIDVLRGAERIIRECRPCIYIEVQHYNRPIFEQWLTAHAYRSERTFPHDAYDNIIATPVPSNGTA